MSISVCIGVFMSDVNVDVDVDDAIFRLFCASSANLHIQKR